jgi:hypothetical protein
MQEVCITQRGLDGCDEIVVLLKNWDFHNKMALKQAAYACWAVPSRAGATV